MLDRVGNSRILELFRTITPLAVQPGEHLGSGPVRSPFAKELAPGSNWGRVGEGFVQPSLVPFLSFEFWALGFI